MHLAQAAFHNRDNLFQDVVVSARLVLCQCHPMYYVSVACQSLSPFSPPSPLPSPSPANPFAFLMLSCSDQLACTLRLNLHVLLQAPPTAVALPAEGVASLQAEPMVAGTEVVDAPALGADSKQVNHSFLSMLCTDSTVHNAKPMGWPVRKVPCVVSNLPGFSSSSPNCQCQLHKLCHLSSTSPLESPDTPHAHFVGASLALILATCA